MNALKTLVYLILFFALISAVATAPELLNELCIALTWPAVCCHVTVTGAVTIIAAIDATLLVIGTSIRPIVWHPKLV